MAGGSYHVVAEIAAQRAVRVCEDEGEVAVRLVAPLLQWHRQDGLDTHLFVDLHSHAHCSRVSQRRKGERALRFELNFCRTSMKTRWSKKEWERSTGAFAGEDGFTKVTESLTVLLTSTLSLSLLLIGKFVNNKENNRS